MFLRSDKDLVHNALNLNSKGVHNILNVLSLNLEKLPMNLHLTVLQVTLILLLELRYH